MSDDLLGSLVNKKYRLLSVLGKGAMGVVYRAAQLDAQGAEVREVALKMIRHELLDEANPKATRRFVTEVHAAARLKSPNVVTVYDFGQSEAGDLYYVMELVEGPTLRDILDRQGPLPIDRVLTIGTQICEALHAAHAQAKPIVHRDLKPANIFIDRWPEGAWARVCDFGIAKVLGEDSSGVTRTGHSPGTPRYMAPEQWRGEGIDPRTDLYALGAILFELVTGHPPFSGDANSLLYQHQHRPPPALPPSVPGPLRSLIEGLLAKDPQHRPPSASHVRRAIEGIAARGFASASAADTTASTGGDIGEAEPSASMSHGRKGGPPAGAAGSRRRTTVLVLVVLIVAGALGAFLFPETLPRVWPRLAGQRTQSFDEQTTAGAATHAESGRIQEKKKSSPGIAVLAFRNERQGDKENDWISTALQTAFSTEFGKVNELKVYSQESLDLSRSSSGPIPMLKQLGASKFISGSFAIHAGAIRVDARLVDVETGIQEHAESVQGRLDDFFDLQKRLALTMLEELPVEVSDKERTSIAKRNPSDNPAAALDAYKLLLQGEGLDEPGPVEPEASDPPRNEKQRTPALSSRLIEGLLPARAWAIEELDAAAPAGAENGTRSAILKTLEDYRKALEGGDLETIGVIKGSLSERQRAGLKMYFENAANLRVDFESIQIEPLDQERFAVSYLRRDSFTDRRTDENVTLEIRIESSVVSDGEQWRLTNDRRK